MYITTVWSYCVVVNCAWQVHRYKTKCYPVQYLTCRRVNRFEGGARRGVCMPLLFIRCNQLLCVAPPTNEKKCHPV